jgi:hypothetical protein
MSDKRSQYTAALSILSSVATEPEQTQACDAASEAMGATTSGYEGRALAEGPARAVLESLKAARAESSDPKVLLSAMAAEFAYQASQSASSERATKFVGIADRYLTAVKSLG